MGALIRSCAVALVAVTAMAQVHENVTVELIEVPVYVFGPDGKPVRGLTKENFELRVNRRAQPVEYFEAMDFGAPATVATAPQQPRTQSERRLYLLLFDQLYSAPPRLRRAQRAADDVVQHSNPATDFFAVATYTANRGVQLATPFIADRTAIRRAIGTLTVSSARDPFGLTISSAERMTWDEKSYDVDMLKDVKLDEQTEETVMGGAANQEMLTEPAKNLIDDQLGNFGDLAQRLSRLEGQKHVLLFSEGFRSSLLHGGEHPVPVGFASGAGLDARTLRKLGEMLDRFRAAGVFLDTVDIAGLHHRPGDSYDNDSLQFLAHGTGGEFVHNQNDFAAAVSDLAEAERVVYVLAFNRRNARGGAIDVRVSGLPRGSRVSYRQAFGSAEARGDVDPLQLADILINDVPQSGLSVQLTATPATVVIELVRKEVVPQLVAKTPVVELILYIFDSAGSAVLGGQKSIVFTAAERARSDPIVLRRDINLPAGHYVAKAIARIAGTTSLGFARTEFTVP